MLVSFNPTSGFISHGLLQGAGTLEHCASVPKYIGPRITTYICRPGYHRTVLLIYQEAAEIDIFLPFGGVLYALQRLQRNGSQQPSADDKKLFDYVLKHARAGEKATYAAIADYALRW